MIIKTRNLENKLLDYVVSINDNAMFSDNPNLVFEKPIPSYSNDWHRTGLIIQTNHISLTTDSTGLWIAYCAYNYADEHEHMFCDIHPLVAVLRCFISLKLGDTVEIPDDVINYLQPN